MEAIIFVGIQGSGKSTYYKEHFFLTHVRINLDMLKTRRREDILLDACIRARQRFVVDNTNPTIEQRAKYIDAAHKGGFRAIAYYFETDTTAALDRNSERQGRWRVPDKAIFATHRKLEPPTLDEGLDEIHIVRIDRDGQFDVFHEASAEKPPRKRSRRS